MISYSVKHVRYGEGLVVEIGEDYATVRFGSIEKKFAIKGFDKFFEIRDIALQRIVNQKSKEEPQITQTNKPSGATIQLAVSSYINQKKTQSSSFRFSNSANVLLGPRAQTIPIASEEQMFEIVGYMARPGRVSSIEAEVPKDGRNNIFERLFPGQTYRPITMGNTPSGMPNKLSSQFRINFASLRNCPQILKENMGAGNLSCVGRINKSEFVLTIVENYGFRFGDRQNTNEIRQIAAERGYLEAFERGYSL